MSLMLLYFVLVLLICACLVQVGLLRFVYAQVARYPSSPPAGQIVGYPPLSIVLCARNESANLRKNIEHLLLQDYPEFELVVVLHDCRDDSARFLNTLGNKYPNLVVHECPFGDVARQGKKFALHQGILKAKNGILLLCDADCWPASSQWAKLMVSSLLQGQYNLVLGYSPYAEEPGLLNRWIRFEAFFTAVQYLGWALAGRPYMGVGRNLLYRKQVYLDNCDSLMGSAIASGDDDLFVNRVANAENTAVCLHPEAFVYSSPQRTWSSYLRQKQRHVSAGVFYKWTDQLRISLQSVSQIIFFICAIWAVATGWYGYFIFIIACKSIIYYFLIKPLKKKLYLDLPVNYLLLFDALMVLYYLILSPYLFFKTRKWI